MYGKELVESLTAAISEHGDLPVKTEDGRPVDAWAFLKAQDSSEEESCVYFYSEGDTALKASEVIERYVSARDSSASNEAHPWDEQWVMTQMEEDFEVILCPVGVEDFPGSTDLGQKNDSAFFVFGPEDLEFI